MRLGLTAKVDHVDYPVVNYSVGGLLLGNAGMGFSVGQRIFMTIYLETRPAQKIFLYGYVVWTSFFDKLVGVDFAKPSEDALRFLEGLSLPARGAPPRRPTGPQKKEGWLGRLLKG